MLVKEQVEKAKPEMVFILLKDSDTPGTVTRLESPGRGYDRGCHHPKALS
ncbi:hypothetical protein Poly21_57420 [Allorhodopirellula heiligendammensis]|uniref:Uncharacterized protein n=1 Tax=Allorhodopirellula heiligendammensis TaxID=2714739 RepID=A0A5C6B0P5_9BACT|nr:hypothetical protein Poly21_57420 [Allorhodopirellula heiligendammensis]